MRPSLLEIVREVCKEEEELKQILSYAEKGQEGTIDRKYNKDVLVTALINLAAILLATPSRSDPESSQSKEQQKEDDQDEFYNATDEATVTNKKVNLATKSQSQNEGQGNEIQQDPNSQRQEDCKFFRRGLCKFGSKCRFRHGKICQKYRKHGRFEGGCNLGSKCPKVHLFLCKESYHNRKCANQSCKYSHIQNPRYLAKETVERRQMGHFGEQTSFLGEDPVMLKMKKMEQQMDRLATMMPALQMFERFLIAQQQQNNQGAAAATLGLNQHHYSQ